MFHDAFSVSSAAACAQERYADILTIGASRELDVYLAGLFEQSGWTISGVPGRAAAREYLQDARAAVAVCEEILPDGSWREVALDLNSIPNPPRLVVAGGGEGLLREVTGLGGFDALRRPLRDSEVVWSLASAWHEWGKRCSGA